MVDSNANLMCEVSAPVWQPCPQMPQVAEFGALGALNFALEDVAEGFSDCKNVVDLVLQGPDRFLSPKLAHSGFISFGVSGAGPKLASLNKVDAHQ
eukprot:1939225-Pyramimonas_sp.AAC.1